MAMGKRKFSNPVISEAVDESSSTVLSCCALFVPNHRKSSAPIFRCTVGPVYCSSIRVDDCLEIDIT